MIKSSSWKSWFWIMVSWVGVGSSSWQGSMVVGSWSRNTDASSTACRKQREQTRTEANLNFREHSKSTFSSKSPHSKSFVISLFKYHHQLWFKYPAATYERHSFITLQKWKGSRETKNKNKEWGTPRMTRRVEIMNSCSFEGNTNLSPNIPPQM